MSDYQEFLQNKDVRAKSVGKEPGEVNPMLFPFQRDIVRWAVRKGRAAIFADTGLGKSFMQLEWARLIGEKTLIVAPLAVAFQTIEEAAKLGLTVRYVKSGDETIDDGLYITNYERVDKFNADLFPSVILDESSILKALDSRTRLQLTEQFKNTPYKLACTATPAPNELIEIVNHADFLGIMTRKEVFGAFFMNENGGKGKGLDIRLKKHAVKPFYRWLASWSMAIKKPSDLGYDDAGYILPELNVHPYPVKTDYVTEGQLFFTELKGITDRTRVQRATLTERVAKTVELVNAGEGQWIIWHHLNDEGYELQKALPGSVLVEGKNKPEEKAAAFQTFAHGETRILITKPEIAGFGLNFQQCSQMVFAGLNDSWEQYYQAVRRCYRFGQTKPVNVHLVYADVQEVVRENIQRKGEEAKIMTDSLILEMQGGMKEELSASQRSADYRTGKATGQNWELFLGDSVEEIKKIASDSVGLSVFSPPFISRYVYTPTERDLGNCATPEQFNAHFGFIIDELLRITMPGRNVVVHCQQVRTTKRSEGFSGLYDFRGDIIREFSQRGFHWISEVTIDKNPQAQAIRRKSHHLLFSTLRRDSSALAPALADYLLIFKKPGENAVPVVSDVDAETWIEWAHPVWYDIRETDVLPVQAAKGGEDEAHLCPLQLGLIERCVRLYTNKGEKVFTPFAGIGSEVYEAVRLGRYGIGIELKPEYWETAQKNLRNAELLRENKTLWDWSALQGQAVAL